MFDRRRASIIELDAAGGDGDGADTMADVARCAAVAFRQPKHLLLFRRWARLLVYPFGFA